MKSSIVRLFLILSVAGGVQSLHSAWESGHDIIPTPKEFVSHEGVLKAASFEALPIAYETDPSVRQEGYRLCVDPQGIRVSYSDDAGRFYAIITLKQLIRSTATGIEVPCAEVSDYPVFPYRGVMFDVSRHFFPKSCILKELDLLAEHKFNVMHWHLSDNEGWRFGLDCAPEMRADEYYTKEDMREVIARARELHIRVIPEVELPGHCRALVEKHPEFRCVDDNGVVLAGVREICAANEVALRFYERVIDEVSEIFPDELLHIGGDEVNAERSWLKCAKCRALIRERGYRSWRQLQGTVTDRFAKHLAAKGKTAGGWSTILNGAPSATNIIRHAGSTGTAPWSLMQGYRTVDCNENFCYFDWPQDAEPDGLEYIDWKPLVVPFRNVYGWNPYLGVPEELKPLLMGSLACNWSEHTYDVSQLEHKLWPRAMALAEVLWAHGGHIRKGRYPDFVRRCEKRIRELRGRGINSDEIK